MDDVRASASSLSHVDKGNEQRKAFGLALPTFFVQIPQRLENCLKSHFQKTGSKGANSALPTEKGSNTSFVANLDKQLEIWKENPTWVEQSPEVKVTIPKGSLCSLNCKVKVGLPPDAIYDIVTDPDNKRVFKNIKEVISRKVLLDEGSRQVVEVEQAAIWRFLWWSGTISVHVKVDQNREDHSMKFKQVKTGFMEKFEGSWKVQPLFIDEQTCYPFKPKTLTEYDRCTRGKGRVGSIVSLEQLIQPSILPPPPISWYLRGITTRTTEMLINDLLAEAARIRGDFCHSEKDRELVLGETKEDIGREIDIKESWKHRRKMRNVKDFRNDW